MLESLCRRAFSKPLHTKRTVNSVYKKTVRYYFDTIGNSSGNMKLQVPDSVQDSRQ